MNRSKIDSNDIDDLQKHINRLYDTLAEARQATDNLETLNKLAWIGTALMLLEEHVHKETFVNVESKL